MGSLRESLADTYYRLTGKPRHLFDMKFGYKLRSRRELGREGRAIFRQAKATAEYQAVYEEAEPLVSICIATYNRAELLVERSLKSSLSQTYPHVEVIVVGDCCTDNTEKLVAKIGDPRVRFVNLPRRGEYPSDPNRRWMVAGTAPVNCALALSSGAFVTHLDDDDEHRSDRTEQLVKAMLAAPADLLFHPFEIEKASGEWRVNDAKGFIRNEVTTSSIFYHRWFRQIGWDPLAYRYGEPGDWNRLRKFAYLGAEIRRHDGVMLKHFREHNQPLP